MSEKSFSVSREILASAKWNMLPTLARYLSLAVGMLLVAKCVQPADFGTASIASSFTALFLLLSQFGFAQAIVGLQSAGKELADTLFTVSLLLASILYIGMIGLAGWLAVFYRNERLSVLVAVTGLGLFVSLASSIPTAILQRNLHYKGQAMVNLATSLGGILTVIPLALSGAGVWALVLPNLFGSLAGGLVAFRLSGYRPRLALRVQEIRAAMNFGGAAFVSNITNYLSNNSVTFIMGKAWSPAQLGYFSFAYSKQSVAFDSIASQVAGSLFPILTRISHDKERLKATQLRILSASAYVITPLYLVILLGAPVYFPFFFGSKWNEAILPFQILCATQIAKILTLGLNPLIYALRKPHWSSVMASIRAFLFAIAVTAAFLRKSELATMAGLIVVVELFSTLAYLVAGWRLLGTTAADLLRAVAAPALLSAGLGIALLACMDGLKSAFWLNMGTFSLTAAALSGLYLAASYRRLGREFALIRARI